MLRTRIALVTALLMSGLASCGAARSHAAGHGPPGTGGLRNVGLMSGGHSRSYLLYVPPGDSRAHPLPLVLIFHGALDTASRTTGETDLLRIAERRHNMILAFPQGYQDTWNEGTGHTPAQRAGINDVAFTAAILHRIESHYAVDTRRVVATGLSNGALLTELLGCELAAQLTLIAPVEGQLQSALAGGCSPSEPISVYEVHGTADYTIPYGGGAFEGVGGGTTVLSATASVARWAALDRCGSQPQDTTAGNLTLSSYKTCQDGVGVTLATVNGGEHAWPPHFGQTLDSVIASLSAERPGATT